MINEKGEEYQSVCVLCGNPWLPRHKNRCECGGFCTWGPAKGADPSSWIKTSKGWIPRPVPKVNLPKSIWSRFWGSILWFFVKGK